MVSTTYAYDVCPECLDPSLDVARTVEETVVETVCLDDESIVVV